ncbi:MAG: response regulator, partial [Comamonadaceae bacterium]
HRVRHGRVDVGPRLAASPRTRRLPRRDVPHLLVQPAHGRRWRCRRGVLRRLGRHEPRAERAAPVHPGRHGFGSGRCRPSQRRARCSLRVAGPCRPRPAIRAALSLRQQWRCPSRLPRGHRRYAPSCAAENRCGPRRAVGHGAHPRGRAASRMRVAGRFRRADRSVGPPRHACAGSAAGGAGFGAPGRLPGERREPVPAEAFEARTAERDRLRSLYRQAPGFICVLGGPDHVYELVNEAYYQLVGHRDIEGKPIRTALPELAGQGFFELLDEVYRTGRPFVGQGSRVMLQRERGAPLAERYIDFVYQPVVDASGVVSGVFAEGYDVTEKMRAESDLRALNSSLEARITERTRDLENAVERLRQESAEREAAQEALRQSQKMEAVGQLTGGIAHDFNNLLQGITGSLDVLKLRLQLGKTDNLDRLIAGAMGSAQRAAGLTHRLLAFSRRQPLDPKPVKANQLVAPMEDLLRRTMGENIRIELVLAAGLWTTLCDANQLESAILNLCINARDAMPDGGMLTVETSNASLDDGYVNQMRDVKAGQYVCVSVTDTGTGMAPDVLSKAFDPFFTTKPIGQGTGLGLSMIYGFAKQSQGHARLYSEPGRGTSAKIYLPRHHGEDTAPPPLPRIEPDHHTDEGEILLVVEDEPVVRALVVDLLQGLGYRTVQASDGAEALRILQSSQRVDLLVTDVGLPQMNGRQVFDAARVNRPELKVLFMTGYAENATLANGFLKPGMEMITKPFAMEKLAGKVQKMLRPE